MTLAGGQQADRGQKASCDRNKGDAGPHHKLAKLLEDAVDAAVRASATAAVASAAPPGRNQVGVERSPARGDPSSTAP